MSAGCADIDRDAVAALVAGRHGDPFALLGPHDAERGSELRAFVPGARAVEVLDEAGERSLGTLARLDPVGFFCGKLEHRAPYRLRLHHGDGRVEETADPYSFPTLLPEAELQRLHDGSHCQLANLLGAQPMRVDGVDGVRFAVWAPNASRVSVVGDFNGWDGRRHPMRLRHTAGVWELFLPQVRPGQAYKYELLDRHGHLLPLKADPCARATELPPATASRVPSPEPFAWSDAGWMQARAETEPASMRLSVYELHVGSWLPAGEAVDWGRLAERLIPYALGMGFTHIELMPVSEHPFGGSWGYQPLGLFAPSARWGTPAEFARFVDSCHDAGLGVLLDWVPGHFPTDAHGLARFDGSALYEHADPREGYQRDWNTLIYNHGRNEVIAFLISSALEWLERYHLDGLRVDAVASMLYRDYSRPADAWVPNIHGGRENYEAIGFLRQLNRTVHARVPGALMIAEESTAWPGVTADPAHGGLGFDFKWNMGWMHDTLEYFAHQPIHRRYHHDRISFGLLYAFDERFVLPISHDEVVHGKHSLLGRMPGDDWQRFANLRAFLGLMWAHPGKKLLFMGCEIGQREEWNHEAGVDWAALDDPRHRGVQRLVRDLNRSAAARDVLHSSDADATAFSWLDHNDAEASVFAFLRRGRGGGALVAVANLTPVPRHGYRLGVPHGGRWREVLNTDAGVYGGSGLGNGGGLGSEAQAWQGQPHSIIATLPPLAVVWFMED
ncbi:MAG TPA: 1,4-alpha-glucan branching protein GlgB [Rhodanobacteraceae bacterium]|nr:1,4-alpha-glucan branching protein GlgB [Rhodanobacteraceae bacterium]